MAPRAKLVRNLPKTERAPINCVDVLMTRLQFTALKNTLYKELRARNDPAPRVMNSGTGDRKTWFGNIKALLDNTPGGRIVRGYKLFVVPLDAAVWKGPAWKALFHMVVESTTPNGTKLYECASQAHLPSEQGSPFIFLPSSRAHADVSDEDFVANMYMAGRVYGGNSLFADAICNDQQIRGRKCSVISTSPEECIARRNVNVHLLPNFLEWFNVREIEGDAQTVAEQFGMPCFNVGENIDMDDLEVMYDAVQESDDALINGLEGLKMTLGANHDLLCGITTIDKVRVDFFAYYDNCFERVSEIQKLRESHRLNSTRLN